MAGFVGGKNGSGVFQKIISLIPPHDVYVEPFVGTGAVLRNKRLARRSVALDLSPGTIDKLSGVVPQEAPGHIAPEGNVRSRFRSITDGKDDVSSLFPGTELIVGDGVEYLKRMAIPSSTSVFVYADPPYVRSARADPDRDYYEHEWTDADHATFLDVVDRLPCNVMISGYESLLYTSRLDQLKWRACRYTAQTRGGLAEEWLWMNYERPERLHDYRYIGCDFPGRWRIRKRQRSWLRMLKQMPPLERRAMLAAVIDEFGDEVFTYLDGYDTGGIDKRGGGIRKALAASERN